MLAALAMDCNDDGTFKNTAFLFCLANKRNHATINAMPALSLERRLAKSKVVTPFCFTKGKLS